MVATIWPGRDNAIERAGALSLLEGYRRREVDVNISSPREAMESFFATVAADMGNERDDETQQKEPANTQAQRCQPPPLTMGAISNTAALVDGILSRIDDHLSTRAHPNDDHRSEGGQEEDQYENKKAKVIREHYRHVDKFAGDLEENWSEKLEDFVHACNMSKIKTTDRHMYMSYSLKDEVLKFFRDSISGKIVNWGEIVQVMNAGFNPPIRQQNLLNRLIRISIEDFMGDNKIEAEALRDLILEIKRLCRMGRPQDRYDEQKRLFTMSR